MIQQKQNRFISIALENEEKVLIFSDTHLYAKRFEPKRFEFLKEIIKESDLVVINGDFYEGLADEFIDFIKSPWNALFPLLKEKHAIYINGNHDTAKMADEKISLFSDYEADCVEVEASGKIYHIEHGQRFVDMVPFLNALKVPSRLVVKTFDTLKIETLMIRLHRLDFIYKIYRSHFNKLIKEKSEDLRKEKVLICGHTHTSAFELNENFINLGIVQHGLASYAVISKDGIKLFQKWYDKPKIEKIFEYFFSPKQVKSYEKA